ncbi:MAG: NAD-dependent deacylase [Phycisphaerales bacterium]
MSAGEALTEVSAALRMARSVVVLTGAGVSAESGVRTFRDAMEGLWKEYDPAQLATPEAFARDPELVTRWYDWRRQSVLCAEPNPGHAALVEMQRRVEGAGGTFTLVTQNVDRLHQRAGSRGVVELHGSIVVWRCACCGRKVEPRPGPFERFPPPSPWCAGELLRPDVVWFGEMLPPEAVAAAEGAVAGGGGCNLFLSVGTSAVVYPAAGFAHAARARGARVAEINRETTPLSPLVDWSLRGLSGEVLPRVVERAWGTSTG